LRSTPSDQSKTVRAAAASLVGLPFTALRDGILAHPTVAEGLNMLCAEVRPAM
jgi:hypothetical protein